MKVKIGPHPRWWGPYQIAELLCFWVPETKDEFGCKTKPEWVHNFGTWLSETDGKDSLLLKVCQWIQDRRQRHVYVRIDHYDSWNADHTLSLIALPLLRQLKATKHGAPHVDDEDVPPGLGLRSTEAPAKENDWDVDANHFDRWEWVLDEIIWAHQQEAHDNPGEQECWQHDLPDPNWPYPKLSESRLDQMLGNTSCDDAKLQAFHQRKQNGFRLFGKYYQALWD